MIAARRQFPAGYNIQRYESYGYDTAITFVYFLFLLLRSHDFVAYLGARTKMTNDTLTTSSPIPCARHPHNEHTSQLLGLTSLRSLRWPARKLGFGWLHLGESKKRGYCVVLKSHAPRGACYSYITVQWCEAAK